MTADAGHTWVEVEGEREFNRTDSEVLDCVINDEQLSVILRNEDRSQVRLSDLLLPDGWNLSLTVNASEDSLLNGALSYEGSVGIMEAGEVTSQAAVALAANCNP